MPRLNLNVTLNLKLLLICFATIVLVGGLAHGAYRFQWNRNSSTLRDMAKQAEEEGNVERAMRFLGQYVRRVPTDHETQAQYGLWLDKQATSPRARYQAMGVFEQVLVRNPENKEVRRRLALLAVEEGAFDTARPHLQYLLKSGKDAELEFQLGRCFDSKKESDEAMKWYKSAATNDPSRIEAYARLAGLQRDVAKKPKVAEDTISEMVLKNKDSYLAYLARAQFRKEAETADPEVKKKALDAAASDVETALRLAPDEPRVLFAAADMAQKRSTNLDKARGYLQRILKKYPKSPAVYESLASVELKDNKPEEALKHLRQGVKELPHQSSLQWNLANLLIQKGDLGEAKETLKKLQQMEIQPGRLDYLKAGILAREGKWREAGGVLESILPYFSDAPDLALRTNALLAQCYDNLGDPDRSLMASRRATALDPSKQEARLGLAATLLKLGRLEDALEEYRRLMESPQAPPDAWTTYARLLIAHNLRVAAPQREWNRVDEALNKAGQAKPDSVEVPILRAQSLLAQGKVPQAKEILRTARDKQPKKVELWMAMAALEERDGKPEAGHAILKDAERQLGDSAELRLAKIGYFLGQGNKESAGAIRKLGEGLDRFSDADRARLLGSLGEAENQLHNSAEAKRLWDQLAALEPRNLNVRLLLFDLALQNKDDAPIQELLEAVKNIEGAEQPLGLYSEARYCIWKAIQGNKSRLAEARGLLDKVESRRPSWARVPLARAQIDELEENMQEQAIDNYLRAIELGDRQPEVARRVVEMLFERRRYTEADMVMRKLPDQVVTSGNLRDLAARISFETGDFARALELAQRAVPEDSKDYRDFIWLGQVLQAAGKTQEVEPTLQKAIRLAETNPAPWVAMVQFLGRTKQTAKAETVIGEARRKIARDQADQALAECYAAINRLDLANQHYLAALQAKPADVLLLQACAEFYLRTGQMQEAERVFRTLIGMVEKDPEAAKRAQKLLPVVLTAEGSYQKSREALALVEASGSGTETVEAQRLRAVVLATQMTRKHNQEAVRILESLDQRQPLAAEDQFLLVQLYDRLGDKKFSDRLQRLLRANGDNPRYLAYYISVLLKKKDPKAIAEAEKQVAIFEKLFPSQIVSVELRARLLKAQGKDAGVVSLIKDKIPVKDAQTALGIANLLEELGQPSAAEEFFRKYVAEEKQPEAALVLARFLARQNRLNEALDLCERAWTGVKPETVAYAYMSVMHAGKPSEEQYRRVQQFLERALQKDAALTALVMCQADLADLRGRYEEAEALYRKMLEKNSRSPEALNNLAWLLAQSGAKGEEAVLLVNRAVDILGPIPELLDTRALAYLTLKQTGPAIADLEEAIARPSIDAKVLASAAFHLSRAYLIAGKRENAGQALAKASAAGLEANGLHPLERNTYQALLREVNKQ